LCDETQSNARRNSTYSNPVISGSFVKNDLQLLVQ